MIPDNIPDQNILFTRTSLKLEAQHKLIQKLLKDLMHFGDGPRNIDVPPNYSMEDVKAVKKILDPMFRIEIRIASGGIHLRFYRE